MPQQAGGSGGEAPDNIPVVNNNTPSEVGASAVTPASQTPAYNPINDLTINGVYGGRASKFAMDSVERHPVTVAKAIVSSIPTQYLATVDTAMREGYNYVMAADSFAGIPGAFTGARIRALAIGDPQSRAEANAFIDSLRVLPMEQQQAMLGVLNGTDPSMGIPGGTGIELPNTNAGMDKLIAIKQLFPDAALTIGTGNSFWTWLDDLSAELTPSVDKFIDDFGKDPLGQTVHTITEGLGGMLTVPLGAIAWGSRKLGLDGMAQFIDDSIVQVGKVGDVFGRELQLGVGLLTGVPEYNIITGRGREPGESWWEQLQSYADVTGPDQPWTVISFDYAGLDINAPENQGYRRTINEISGLEAAIGGFEVMKAVRLGYTTPSEFVGRIPGGIIGRDIAEANLRTADLWVQTESGAKFINKVYETYKAYGDDAAGFKGALDAKFKGTSAGLREALSRGSTRSEFGRIFVDYVASPGGDVARQVRLLKATRANAEEIARAEKVMPAEVSAVRAATTEVPSGSIGMAETNFAPKPFPEFLKDRGIKVEDVHPDGNGVFHADFKDDLGHVGRTYFVTDDAHIVQGFRTIDSSGHAFTVTNLETRGIVPGTSNSYGGRLIDAQWREYTLSEVIDSIKRQSDMTPAAKRMNIRAAERKFGGGDPNGLTGQRLMSLKMRDLQLKSQLAEQINKMPTWKWPRYSTMRSMVRGTPLGKTERLLNAIYSKQPIRIERLYDDLPRTAHVYEPGARPDWADFNVSYTTKLLNRANVPAPLVRRLTGKVTELLTRGDMERWLGEVADAIEVGITKGGTRHIDPTVIHDIVNRLRNPSYETNPIIHDSIANVNGNPTVIARGILEYPAEIEGTIPRVAPAMPSDFTGGRFAMPNVERIVDATSATRRWATGTRKSASIRDLKQSANWEDYARALTKRAEVLPYDATKLALNLGTVLLKAPVLVFRLPAMILRIEMEQMARNLAYGYKPLLFNSGILGDVIRGTKLGGKLFGSEGFFRKVQRRGDIPDINELGMILSETHDSFVRGHTQIDLSEYRKNPMSLSADPVKQLQVLNTQWESLVKLRGDWLTRYMSTHSIEETIAFLKSDPAASFWFERDMLPELKASLGDKYAPSKTRYTHEVTMEPYEVALERRQLEGGVSPTGIERRVSPERIDYQQPITREVSGTINNILPGAQTAGEAAGIAHGHGMVGPGTYTGRFDIIETYDFNAGMGLGPTGQTGNYYMIQRIGKSGEKVGEPFLQPVEEVSIAGEAKSAAGGIQSRLTPAEEAFAQDDFAARLTAADRTLLDFDVDGAMNEWLAGVDRYINEVTGGNPELRRSIGTGGWRIGDPNPPATLAGKHGNDFGRSEYVRLQEEIKSVNAGIREELASETPNVNILGEKYRRQQEVLDRLDELEGAVRTADYIDMRNKRAVQQQMGQSISDGTYELPTTIMADSNYKTNTYEGTPWENINKMLDGYSRMVYKPFKAASWADIKGTRGSLYYQELERSYQTLIDNGWEGTRALEVAQHRAAEVTRDVMYDLSARTSAHRAVQNLFWFAPAWQEILTTWLIKVPAQSYWPVGMMSLINMGQHTLGLLKEANVITTMEINGEQTDIIRIPGISDAIEKITGLRVPDIAYGKPSGLNLVFSGLPGIAPVPGAALGALTIKNGGVFKALSDVLMPFGLDVSYTPAMLTYGWEALFGTQPPWGSLSQQYNGANFDRARDQAGQDAYASMVQDGLTIPRIEDFSDITDPVSERPGLSREAERTYIEARDKWWDEWQHRQDQYFSGTAFVRFLGASVSPLSLRATEPEREFWRTFYDNFVVPEGYDEDGSLSDAQKALINGYLEKHPDSVGYSVGYTGQGEPTMELPWKSTGEEAYYDKLRTGELYVLEPKDYQVKLQAIESLRHYRERQAAALAGLGKNAPQRLRNYYKVSQLVLQNKEEWNRYLALDGDVAAYLKKSRIGWEERYGYPVQSYSIERQAQLLTLMKTAAPFFMGAGGLRDTDYRHVVGALGQLYSENGVFGEPSTKLDKGLAWYFDNVMGKYMETVGPLYEQASELTARGIYSGDIYAKISRITTAYGKRPLKGPDGLKYPSPEEYFWGNRTEGERKNAIIAWTTKPPSWLTPFQLKKVGFNSSPQALEFLKFFDEKNAQFYDYIKENDVSPSSKDYERAQHILETTLYEGAKARGPVALKMLKLSEAPPLVRLNETDFGAENENWGFMTDYVTRIYNAAQDAGNSIKGYAESILPMKIYLETVIEKLRDPSGESYDREFDHMWSKLSRSFSEATEGVTMYEAIFFGQFTPDFISPDLIDAVHGSGRRL